MKGVRLALLITLSLGAAFALISVRASAAPKEFSLTFEGVHVADPGMPESGVRHDGRFTASAPMCSTGRASDVKQATSESGFLMVWRLHTCDDGSGSFTAYLPIARREHDGKGSWQIVEGTGTYASLRGQGTYTGTLVSGDPNDFPTISYRTQWQGVVDFDADPPAIARYSASARKLRLPRPTYSLRIAVTAQDPSTPILFNVEVRAEGGRLASSRQTSTAGSANFVLRISPPRTARSARIALTTTDALGNQSSSLRSVRLR
jgi:hypothetical protein